jgi:hypothetical protein
VSNGPMMMCCKQQLPQLHSCRWMASNHMRVATRGAAPNTAASQAPRSKLMSHHARLARTAGW